MDEKNDRHRIDMWLKLVCIYKHRSEATDACNGGHIKLNGRSVKASAALKENDVVQIVRGERERKFVVLAFPSGSVSKEQARTYYRDESPAPPAKDDWMARMPAAPQRDKGAGRPTKRDRRQLEREGFRRGDT